MVQHSPHQKTWTSPIDLGPCPETIGALVLLHLAMAMLRIIVQVKGYSGYRMAIDHGAALFGSPTWQWQVPVYIIVCG